MTVFTYLQRALAAECIKIKNTLVPWLVVFAPAFVVVVAFVASYTGGDSVYKDGVNPWLNFSGHILVGWSLFVFPIYVSLQSALYAGIEHQNRAWAYQCSLPVPKWAIYLGKLLILTLLVAGSHLVLIALSEGAGWLLGTLKPRYRFQNFSMHTVLAAGSVCVLIAGLGMLAIQMLVSMMFESFLIPAALGLFATMVGAVSRGFLASKAFPYLWPSNILNSTHAVGDWQFVYLLAGIVTYWAIGCAGIFWFNRKSIH